MGTVVAPGEVGGLDERPVHIPLPRFAVILPLALGVRATTRSGVANSALATDFVTHFW
mgnify:CR=1 FL=1